MTEKFEQALDAKLAIDGGPKVVSEDPNDESLFHWPIVTEEDEQAVIEVLRTGKTSANDITRKFEQEFAEWTGVKHALAYCNGTAALLGAFWACEIGAGDEIICPATTYWASATGALQLGATVNFADIDPDTLCLNPDDIEHRIGLRTKAIVVVHYAGHPCDMDRIVPIARRHGLRIIEDASHAHGSLYKGRMCGTLGDIAAMSMMGGKSFSVGEGGMMLTNDRTLFERCAAFGFYERTSGSNYWCAGEPDVTDPELLRFKGLPIGSFKHRLNQTCSAMGRVQLKHYPARIAEIQRAMNRFWDLLEGTPGIKPHRPAADSGSTMGGWYSARGLYRAEELGGLPCAKFCEAVRVEGVSMTAPGANFALHTHPVFHEADIFRQGQPTAIAFGQRDVRQSEGALPVAEGIFDTAFAIPWFKHDRPERIAQYAAAYGKVARQYSSILGQ